MHIPKRGITALAAMMALFVAVPAVAVACPAPTAGAVGDSFISGEGGLESGPYLAGSDTPTDQCHRSASGPVVLAAAIDKLKLTVNASCSGATTQNITKTGQYGELAQAWQLNAGLKTVFVSIGGNDVGFGTIVGCVIQTDCDQTTVPAQTLQAIDQLGPKLDKAYFAIRMIAPRAKVVVNLYPPIAPKTRGASDAYCPEINDAELALANQIQDRLNQTITQHARQFGFLVADASALFARHSVCTNVSWFYQPGTVPQAATWHPNALGRAGLAAIDAVTAQQ